MKLISIAVLSIALLQSGCSANQKRPPSGGGSITSIKPGGALLLGFNRNDDYLIDRAEFQEGQAIAFKKADRNSDGTINLSEFRSWQPQAIGSRSAMPNLVYFDRNFDDRISKGEFDAALNKMFDEADQDQDSAVTYDELVNVVVPPQSKRAKGSGSRGGGERKREGRRNQTGF